MTTSMFGREANVYIKIDPPMNWLQRNHLLWFIILKRQRASPILLVHRCIYFPNTETSFVGPYLIREDTAWGTSVVCSQTTQRA